MKKLYVIELNELNTELLLHYIAGNKLPNISKLIKGFGYTVTDSESKYHLLEPWIQWVTVRTGLSYSEHKIFRLGDVVESNINQYWEEIEGMGFSVSAISPINAINRCKHSKLWIPDPWTNSPVSGDGFARLISKTVSSLVNNNASRHHSLKTLISLIYIAFRVVRLPKLLPAIHFMIKSGFGDKPSMTYLLEILLVELFVYQIKKFNPNFSTVFLNGVAHLQHHYMYNSPGYTGTQTNPKWYINPKRDVIIPALQIYDSLLGELLVDKNAKVIICTGLQQVATDEPIYYWRLKDHAKFLSHFNINFDSVRPGMSRDFTVFAKEQDINSIASKLKSITDHFGNRVFGIVESYSNRVFVTLTYEKDANLAKFAKSDCLLSSFMSFVALKNGHHDGRGIYISNLDRGQFPPPSNIADVHKNVINYFSNN